jgi:two-component system, NtrC family, nitrogen regulation sensor histidine kinase GlnL
MFGKNVQSAVIADRLLENMGTAVLVFDARMRLTYLNHAGEVMLAHSARHVCGRSVQELVKNADVLSDQLAVALASEQVLSHRGCRLELPDAPNLRVNCTFTSITDEDGEPSVLVELRQIDYQMRIEHEEHLITQQQATHELVRGLAHEIKNPLGGLRGAAQLLEQEIHDDELREYTRIIISEADRLRSLMDSMLGPNDLPKIQPVNIHLILERVRDLVQAEAGRSLHFHNDYDPSLPDLQADPDLLLQAILNIVRNAAQALGNVGDITVRTRVQRNFNIGSSRHRLVARITITDNGPGIDDDLRKQIFYPMITSRSDGTGLGLSIAQALISRHQGLIECHSQPGKTVFTILLPLEGKHDT